MDVRWAWTEKALTKDVPDVSPRTFPPGFSPKIYVWLPVEVLSPTLSKPEMPGRCMSDCSDCSLARLPGTGRDHDLALRSRFIPRTRERSFLRCECSLPNIVLSAWEDTCLGSPQGQLLPSKKCFSSSSFSSYQPTSITICNVVLCPCLIRALSVRNTMGRIMPYYSACLHRAITVMKFMLAASKKIPSRRWPIASKGRTAEMPLFPAWAVETELHSRSPFVPSYSGVGELWA